MGDPIINAQVDDINTTLGNIKVDLAALRPSIRAIRDAIAETYLTDTIENVPIASFNDGADDIPVRELEVAIEPVQSGSGDPSPDNIRPITGWSAAKVTRTGVNLFGGNLLRDGVLASMETATDHPDDRYVSFTAGAAVTQPLTDACGLSGKFKENTQYTFILTISKTSGTGTNLRVRYTDNTYDTIGGASTTKSTIVFTTAADKTVYSLYKFNNGGTTSLYYDESGIFEGVLTTADFKPYLGTTAAFTFGQTVYGGTLNVTTGELTITHKSIKVSDLTWSYASSISSFRAFNNNFDGKIVSDGQTSAQAFCTAYKIANPSTSAQMAAATYGIAIGSGLSTFRLLINDPTYNGDAAAFKAAMGDTEIVYELDTPTTVQLTAAEVETLFGQNNVWSSSGNVVKLTYRKAWEIALAQGE